MSISPSIYLDYQATTPLDTRVAKWIFPYYFKVFGNPSSAEHSFGWQANDAVNIARQEVADLICADSDEIIFTSGATEANNLALFGLAKGADRRRHKILVSSIEHKSILAPAKQLENHGYKLELIPVDDTGRIEICWLKDNIDEKTFLVSIMAINNEIGTIQDIGAIGEICQSLGVIFHVDAAQAFPTISIDVYQKEIDLLSISGHKIYGPKGIGALYVKRGIQSVMEPIQWGGEQENGLRPGTLPAPLCVGLGKAATLIKEQCHVERQHLAGLRNQLFEELKKSIKEMKAIGPIFEQRHVGNLNVYLPNVNAQELIGTLQPQLAISTGSACASGFIEPSHVLRAIGLSPDEARSCLRISVGRQTTIEEIIRAVELISQAYRTLK